MADDWYYSSGGKKTGPISPIDLKRLAGQGLLTPVDLVWKEGMSQWVPARAVKGLFAANTNPVQTPAPVVATRPRQFHEVHPFDKLIDAARAACPEELADRISVVAGQAGILALYIAAAVTMIGGILLAVRANSFVAFLGGAGVSIAVLVGQYIAYRLLGACRLAIASNRSVVSSLAIPDSAFVLITVATGAGVLGLLWAAIQDGQFSLFVGALATLVVGAFAALVSLTPGGLSLEVEPDCRAAQEAVGVLTFVVKLMLRCTPLVFAAGVAFATYSLIETVVLVMKAQPEGLLFAESAILGTVGGLFALIAVPVYAYFLMLIYYLTLDVVSAIVSLPGKLDLMAEQNGRASQP